MATTPLEHPDLDPEGHQLHRGLTNRHIQLIAIGGAIGTGLFMGAGKTISLAGPSILLVYMIVGFLLFFVMRAMGELLLSNTNYRSFIDFASDLLGPWAGFVIGWTYWFTWIVTGVADLIAIIGYCRFWWPDLNMWTPAIICIVLFLSLNLIAVRLFGEMEFWFSMIKIAAIVGLILVGFYLILSGFQAPDGTIASLSHVWNGGNIFPQGLIGFFAGFQIATFSFAGLELAGTTAAEVKDVEKNLPRAINAIPIRVIIFYVLSLLVIMSVIPWYEIDPTQSPFVSLFVLIGIPIAASLINFVVITAAASSSNSGIFSTSRMLFGLAEKDLAHPMLARLSKNKVPVHALVFSCLCILIAFGVLTIIPTIMGAFTVITAAGSILYMFVWSMILLSYIAYRRKKPHLHKKSIYKMPGGVFMCWVVLFFFAFILVLLSLEADTAIALAVTPFWFVILFVAYGYILRRDRRRKLPLHD